MTEFPPSPQGVDANDRSRGESAPPDTDPDALTGPPRWVKVFGLIAIIVVVLVVILLLAGGGQHGPMRHGLAVNPSLSAMS